jgi:alkylhydroperoxidase family enzyme
MAEPRLANVPLVSDETATGRVAEVFADIKSTKKIGFVPNFWRALATNPNNLDLIWTRLKSLMHPEAVGRDSPLDPLTREIIALAVSVANNCRY